MLVRWTAPEVITPPLNLGRPEKVPTAADVFAFAMLAVEVLTSHVPFASIKNAQDVGQEILRGGRPPRPEAVKDDAVRDLIQACWNQNPSDRLAIGQVVQRLWPLPYLTFQVSVPFQEDTD